MASGQRASLTVCCPDAHARPRPPPSYALPRPREHSFTAARLDPNTACSHLPVADGGADGEEPLLVHAAQHGTRAGSEPRRLSLRGQKRRQEGVSLLGVLALSPWSCVLSLSSTPRRDVPETRRASAMRRQRWQSHDTLPSNHRHALSLRPLRLVLSHPSTRAPRAPSVGRRQQLIGRQAASPPLPSPPPPVTGRYCLSCLTPSSHPPHRSKMCASGR